MNKGKWRSVAEGVGVVAVVASLIFVGLQIKQSQDIALAAQYQSRAEAVQELALVHLEMGYVLQPLRNGLSNGVLAGEINTFHWLWISQDNHFFQYQAGFLDKESWKPQLRNIKSLYARCEMRFVWDWRKGGLRDDFVSFVESLEDPCVSLEAAE